MKRDIIPRASSDGAATAAPANSAVWSFKRRDGPLVVDRWQMIQERNRGERERERVPLLARREKAPRIAALGIGAPSASSSAPASLRSSGAGSAKGLPNDRRKKSHRDGLLPSAPRTRRMEKKAPDRMSPRDYSTFSAADVVCKHGAHDLEAGIANYCHLCSPHWPDIKAESETYRFRWSWVGIAFSLLVFLYWMVQLALLTWAPEHRMGLLEVLAWVFSMAEKVGSSLGVGCGYRRGCLGGE